MNTSDEYSIPRRQLDELVHSGLADRPAEYPSRRQYLLALREAVGQVTAAMIREPLNKHIAALPQKTYAEKKAVAAWLNAELRSLGLAIRCPKTRMPTYLLAHVGRDPEVGRYRLNFWDGAVRQSPVSFNELPPLDFVPAPLSPSAGQARSR